MGDSAWSMTRNWNENDINGFSSYAQSKLNEYAKNGTKMDCADLALSILIGYASDNGLPLQLTTADGKTTFDSNSDNFNTVTDYQSAVTSGISANDIPSNTFSVDKSDKQTGDMILLTKPVNHVASYSSVNPNKLTYGNLTDDGVSTTVKTTGDWSNASTDAYNRKIQYYPDKKHVNRWNVLKIK
jgi:hypothetical protein